MAEFKRLPTQDELSKMLYQMQLGGKSQQDIINENLNTGSTVRAIPDNLFQKMASGAQIAGQQVNKLGNASDVAKLFPGYTGQKQVNIPTGFNFAPKQDPMGGVVPQGLQTQQINVDQLLKAIKPADLTPIPAYEKIYGDVGVGKAPNPWDVLEVAATAYPLAKAGTVAGKGALKAATAYGKFVAPKLGQMAEQYAFDTGLLSPLVAYHGTPHTFDKFDISKVGTGEGAQAYGHGIYFAEAPGVARGYQMQLAEKSGETTTINGKSIESLYEQIQNKANKLPAKEAQIEYDKAAMLEKMMLDTPPDELISYAKDIGADSKVIKWLEEDIAPKTKFPGSFFKVDIPDKSIETFINWDLPLSKQNDNVKKLIEEIAKEENLPINYKNFQMHGKDKTGADFYDALKMKFGADAEIASNILNSYGIGGIKYLDQGSRMAEKGTSNFVVFDPNIVKTLERNNKQVK